MGSGTKRKESDSPIIRTPKQSKNIGGSGSGGGGRSGGSSEDMASVCIPSFDIRVDNNSILRNGGAVLMKKEDSELYSILFLNRKIGEINKKISKMVDVCQEMGVSYHGTLVEERDKFYARFVRK